MSLQEEFEQAAVDIKGLTKRPSNKDLLELYGLYKQGSAGDITGKRPDKFDLFNRSKHDAWRRLKGTSQDDAKQQYIDKVNLMLRDAGLRD